MSLEVENVRLFRESQSNSNEDMTFKSLTDDVNMYEIEDSDNRYEICGSIYDLPGLEHFIIPILDETNCINNINSNGISNVDEHEPQQTKSDADTSEVVYKNDCNLNEDVSEQNNISNEIPATVTNPVEVLRRELSVKEVVKSICETASETNSEDNSKNNFAAYKTHRRSFFSSIFKSKRKKAQNSNKTERKDGSMDNSDVNKSAEVPLNNLLDRDWLNSLGDGVKKKTSVISELKRLFRHGIFSPSKRKSTVKSEEAATKSEVVLIKVTHDKESSSVYDSDSDGENVENKNSNNNNNNNNVDIIYGNDYEDEEVDIIYDNDEDEEVDIIYDNDEESDDVEIVYSNDDEEDDDVNIIYDNDEEDDDVNIIYDNDEEDDKIDIIYDNDEEDDSDKKIKSNKIKKQKINDSKKEAKEKSRKSFVEKKKNNLKENDNNNDDVDIIYDNDEEDDVNIIYDNDEEEIQTKKISNSRKQPKENLKKTSALKTKENNKQINKRNIKANPKHRTELVDSIYDNHEEDDGDKNQQITAKSNVAANSNLGKGKKADGKLYQEFQRRKTNFIANLKLLTDMEPDSSDDSAKRRRANNQQEFENKELQKVFEKNLQKGKRKFKLQKPLDSKVEVTVQETQYFAKNSQYLNCNKGEILWVLQSRQNDVVARNSVGVCGLVSKKFIRKNRQK